MLHSSQPIDKSHNIPAPPVLLKPLLRGWFHALAAIAANIFTFILFLRSHNDPPRLLSLLIYGLSMIELYTISAVYHIVKWRERARRTLRALDHANIFILIAGTYTPLCFNLLHGWLRPTILILIWSCAALGVGLATLTLHAPRWLTAGLYVAMGWIVIFALPAFLSVVPWIAIVWLFLGGILYTIGALIYARRWPNPFPRYFGFHEIFHLFVIAGSIAFAVTVWVWALPFPRV